MVDYSFVAKLDFRKDGWVRGKSDNRSLKFRRANPLHRSLLFSLAVLLHKFSTVSVNFRSAVRGECIYDRSSHSMETTGNLVPFPTKFSTSMQSGHNGLKGRDFSLLVHINRDTSTVVHHAHFVVRQECHFNIVSITTHRLISRVIKY